MLKKVLLFLVDGLADDAEEQLAALLVELREFDPQMLEKTRLVLINKIDLWDESTTGEKQDRFDWADFQASALTGDGVEEVLQRLEVILFTEEKL